MTRTQIFSFIAILCCATWTAQVAILTFVGNPESDAAQPFMFGVMFLPGLLGLFYTIRFRSVRQSVQWLPRCVTPLVLALIVPLLIAAGILTVLSVLNLGVSDYFSINSSQVDIASGPWLLGVGAQGWPHFISNVLLTTAVYAGITSIATIGEEYGWRGVLQNAMIKEFGFVRGVGALGFVWGLWHAPMILAGYNYPETPILGAFILLPVLLLGASFVMAWLTLWNKSFWPAVIMHGAINSVYDSMITKVSLNEPSTLLVPVIEIGLFLGLSAIIIICATKVGAAASE